MPRSTFKLGLLALTGAAVVVSLFLHQTPQPRAYHLFADTRTCLGIPNFFNTASNLVFLVVGAGMLIALYAWRRDHDRMFIARGELWLYGVLYAATALVAFGSGYYHLAPDNAGLFWDRLPMTLVASAFTGIVIAERFGARAGGWTMAAAFVLSCGGLLYWRITQSLPQDNVWPYIAALNGALLFALVAVLLFPSRYTRTRAVWITFAIYLFAMLFDSWLDAPLYTAVGWLSGHTLKHMLAALALFWIGWDGLRGRKRIS